MRWARYTLAALALLATLGVLRSAKAWAGGQPAPLTVRITSPLGRTGSFESVRIVAQIRGPEDAFTTPPVVRFLIDGTELGQDTDGPPYAYEWIDENPFETREITVDVTDAKGRQASDRLVLEPFEVTQVSEVSGVVLEAAVEDKDGRPVPFLQQGAFQVEEDGVLQTIDLMRSEVLPATYVLLIDSSQSMARRIDFVKDAARRLIDFLKPDDRVLVVPFSLTLGAVTGPTADRDTILEAIASIHATGGTAILDCLSEASSLLKDATGRRVVILLTDGYDERSSQNEAQTLEVLRQSGTTTYVVGIGGVAGVSIKGERFLKQMARQSGGRAFFPYRDTELPNVYDHIATDVRQRYLLGYTPVNQLRDGGDARSLGGRKLHADDRKARPVAHGPHEHVGELEHAARDESPGRRRASAEPEGDRDAEDRGDGERDPHVQAGRGTRRAGLPAEHEQERDHHEDGNTREPDGERQHLDRGGDRDVVDLLVIRNATDQARAHREVVEEPRGGDDRAHFHDADLAVPVGEDVE